MSTNKQQALWFRRSNDEQRWEPYTHLENEMIQRAYEKGKAEIELDDFIINFQDRIHMNKKNLEERIPIERRLDGTNGYPTIRSDRFVLQEIHPTEKSFSPGPASFFGTNETMKTAYSHDLVLKAIEGIRQAGERVGKPIEGKCIANRLRKVCGRFWNRESHIQSYIMRLYTMDSFIYRSVNNLMRNADITMGEFDQHEQKEMASLLGPYCGLLKACLNNYIPPAYGHLDTLVYRSANLTREMIEEYRDFIGHRISWECFSSTTTNKNVALLYDGNTLFHIYIPMHPDSTNREVSHYSQFPEESEVLLDAHTFFYVRRVEWDDELKKTIIHLDITDDAFRLAGRKNLLALMLNTRAGFIDRNPVEFDDIDDDSQEWSP